MSVPISQFIPPPLSLLGVHTFVLYVCVSRVTVNTSLSMFPGGSGDVVTSRGSPPWPDLYHGLVVGCGLSPGGMHDLRLQMVFVMLGRRPS